MAISPQARRRLVSHETYELVFTTAYTGLATNLLVVLGCLPLVVLAVTTDTAASWPALALLAPLCTPALVAAFGVFRAFTADGSAQVVRTFWRTYRQHWRRSVALGATSTALVVVLVVDVRAVWGHPVGAVAIPVFVTLVVLTLVTALVAAASLADHPTARLRDVLRASLFAGVRRWYLTLPSLLVLAMLGSVIATRPAVGLGLALAPLLFVAWGGARYALRSTLGTVPAPVAASR
ncbi:YesL family protein [Cellulosimicrobium marinum]|uniref:YesL family protein n=1 Tax=Cellulosimicrobium marinum TaxID=1638992 RepID=UPI001E653E3B|nr:YesL family protein [Cellulosimicrobium marinum]MCB7137429.1 YesL family protein [Cellulosimicrobium marinum]